MADGKLLKEKSQLPSDRESLEEKLDNMTERWTKLNTASDSRTSMLEEAVRLSTEYQKDRSHFLPWLDEAERRLEAIHLSCDADVLESHKQHVQVIRSYQRFFFLAFLCCNYSSK